jgi:hypothetical protein
VPQNVRGHLGAKAGVHHHIREGFSDVPDTLTIPFNGKTLPPPFPAA